MLGKVADPPPTILLCRGESFLVSFLSESSCWPVNRREELKRKMLLLSVASNDAIVEKIKK